MRVWSGAYEKFTEHKFAIIDQNDIVIIDGRAIDMRIARRVAKCDGFRMEDAHRMIESMVGTLVVW